MKEVVLSRGSEFLVTLPIEGDQFRVGRSSANDLSVPDQGVSRHQCLLCLEDDGWWMNDTSGRGTVVDGKAQKTCPIHSESAIELGSLLLRIRDVPDDQVAPITTFVGGQTVKSGGDDKPATLTLSGRASGRNIRLLLQSGLITLGSDPGCDVVLADPYVSGFHCRIYEKKGGWFVKDLESTNGITLNGVQVGEARLEAGQRLRVGDVLFAVLGEEADRDAQQAGFMGIISDDMSMKAVFDRIQRAAPFSETVMIIGETGTGKELVAQALHKLSPRAEKPLVALNCSAITRELMESELFGHEKGAFTGAQSARKGLFEEASGGTLFLDEIGELPLDLQAKLLRVLETGEIRPVGSNVTKQVDTRVLAATHRKLDQLVTEGKFREDLFHRLYVVDIQLPPLRARGGDIGLLADFFLEVATRHTTRMTISDKAREKLAEYVFPGNVRELKNLITRAAILAKNADIQPDDISPKAPTLQDQLHEASLFKPGMTLQDAEREFIRIALEVNGYNQKLAAKQLGIARSTLISKIEKFGIERD